MVTSPADSSVLWAKLGWRTVIAGQLLPPEAVLGNDGQCCSGLLGLPVLFWGWFSRGIVDLCSPGAGKLFDIIKYC